MTVRENLKTVQEKISRACRRAGRNPSEVGLVLITKNVSVEKIREAYEAGVRDFGENRVQELCSKQPGLPSDIRWHFVGRLQTNKVKSILGGVHLLHSLDRLALAEEIQRQAERKNLVVDALVQVNTSGEPTKSGFAPGEVLEAARKLLSLNRIRLRGLMTIGPLTDDESFVRSSFVALRNLREALQKKFSRENFSHLSMGMSSDFEIAVEEGATFVRIGTAVFGERSRQSAVDSPQKEKDNGV